MGVLDHLSCLLRKLYVGQEATVRTGHETMDWFTIGKEVWQNCISSLCLLKLYAEYIVWNAQLDESQTGKIVRKNISNLRYADDTTLIVESEQKLKSLLMKVKEESEKACFKLSIKKKNKTKIITSRPITSWQIDGEKLETVADFIFLGFRITADGDGSHWIKWCLFLGRKAMTSY